MKTVLTVFQKLNAKKLLIFFKQINVRHVAQKQFLVIKTKIQLKN